MTIENYIEGKKRHFIKVNMICKVTYETQFLFLFLLCYCCHFSFPFRADNISLFSCCQHARNAEQDNGSDTV